MRGERVRRANDGAPGNPRSGRANNTNRGTRTRAAVPQKPNNKSLKIRKQSVSESDRSAEQKGQQDGVRYCEKRQRQTQQRENQQPGALGFRKDGSGERPAAAIAAG